MNIYDVREIHLGVLGVYTATEGHGYLSGTAVYNILATAGNDNSWVFACLSTSFMGNVLAQ